MKERADVVVIGAGIVGCARRALPHAGRRAQRRRASTRGRSATPAARRSTRPGCASRRTARSSRARSRSGRRDLYRELDTPERRTWWEVGSLEVATTPERLAECRRRHAYATSWGLESHVITPDEALRHIPLLDRGAPARRAARAERRHRARAPTSARRCRSAPRRAGATFIGHTRATGIDMRGGRVRGVETDQGTIATSTALVCLRPLGARVHARARPAAGRDAADAAPLRLDRAAARAGRRERSRSSTRSCATRTARCTSASAATGYGIGAYGHDPITIEPAELERHPDGHQIATGPFSQEHWPESLGWAHELLPAARAASASPRRSTATSRSRSTTTRSPAPRRRSRGLWLADGIWVTHAGGTAQGRRRPDDDRPLRARPRPDAPRPPARSSSAARSTSGRAARTQYDEVYDIIHPRPGAGAPARRAHDALARALPRPRRRADRERRLGARAVVPRQRRAAAAGRHAGALDAWAQRHWSPTIGREHHATRTGVGVFDLTPFVEGRGRGAGRRRVAQPRLRERDGPPGRAHPLHDGARPRRRLRLRPHRHAPGRRALPARHRRRLGPARRRLAAQRAARGRLRAPARRVLVARRARPLGPARARAAGAAEPDDLVVPVPERARDLGRRACPPWRCASPTPASWAGSSTRRPSTAATSGISSSRPAPTWASSPAGTGAFNSLRMEKGYRFAGVDMTREHTPFEAGLGFTVHFTKPHFNGREAALAARARGAAQAAPLPRARRRRRHLLRRRAARCATATRSAT